MKDNLSLSDFSFVAGKSVSKLIALTAIMSENWFDFVGFDWVFQFKIYFNFRNLL